MEVTEASMAQSRPLKAVFRSKNFASRGSPRTPALKSDLEERPDSHKSSLTTNNAKFTFNSGDRPAVAPARRTELFTDVENPDQGSLRGEPHNPPSRDTRAGLSTQGSSPSKRGRTPKASSVTSPLEATDAVVDPPSALTTRKISQSKDRCRVKLPIITKLCKARSLKPGERHKAIQNLTADQLESLETILKKAIKPTLQKWIVKYQDVRCPSELGQYAESVVHELLRRDLFAILPTSSDRTPKQHKKDVKEIVKDMLEGRPPRHRRPSATSQPVTESHVPMDISMLEAGQAVPRYRATSPPAMAFQPAKQVPTHPKYHWTLPNTTLGADRDYMGSVQYDNSPKRPRGRPSKPKDGKSSATAAVIDKDNDHRRRPRPKSRTSPSVISPDLEKGAALASLGVPIRNVTGESSRNTETVDNIHVGDTPTRLGRLQQRNGKYQRQRDRRSRILLSRSKLSSALGESFTGIIDKSVTKVRRGQDTCTLQNSRLTRTLHSPTTRCKTSTIGLIDELGLCSPTRYDRAKTGNLQEDFHVANTWQRASGDIITGAWHHDSNHYVVGATATTDPLSLQYNRPYNLLFGSIVENTVQELKEHCVDAPKSVHNVSKLFMTVETARFAGDRFYTASHDKTIKIWSASSRPLCLETLSYEREASVLDVSAQGALAVGIKATDRSVHVYGTDDYSQSSVLASSRARDKPDQEIYPSCIAWGTSAPTEHYLLAGFLRWGELEDGGVKKEGHLCLWDARTGQEIREVIVKPSAQGVYTAAWCPKVEGFAAGGIPGTQASLSNRRMHSVVRLWDLRQSQNRYTFELECPARDQGEISFHPWDDNLLVVTCTDGATYAYDCRWPDEVLHRLSHGDPIENNWITGLDSLGQTREEGDGGVMLCQWGGGRDLLYTGSSDGVLKKWDIRRAPGDVFVGDVAQFESGITFGSFSPDCSRLLVGDASGGVHILSCDQRDGEFLEDPQTGVEVRTPRQIGLLYADAPTKHPDTSTAQDDNPGMEGIYLARDDILKGRLLVDPHLGVVQGPNYGGPYNTSDNHQPRNSRAQMGLLEERRQKLALARRAARKQRKRSRCHSEDSRSQGPPFAKRAKLGRAKAPVVEVIDLTGDDDGLGAVPPAPPTAHHIVTQRLPTGRRHVKHGKVDSSRQRFVTTHSSQGSHGSALSWEELLEDDHWFPDEDPMAIGCYMGVGGIMG